MRGGEKPRPAGLAPSMKEKSDASRRRAGTTACRGKRVGLRPDHVGVAMLTFGRLRAGFGLAAGCVLLALAGIALVPAIAGAQVGMEPYGEVFTGRLSLNKTSARPGETVRARGEGFAPDASILLEFDGEGIGEYTAGPDGSFSGRMKVPSDARPGMRTVSAVGAREGGGTLVLTAALRVMEKKSGPEEGGTTGAGGSPFITAGLLVVAMLAIVLVAAMVVGYARAGRGA